MALRSTARNQGQPAQPPDFATDRAAWITRISAAEWIALAACALVLMSALQTLRGQGVDYDEGVYWQSLRAMAEGHRLFDPVFSSQPPLFLLSVYPFYVIFGQELGAARVALAIFAVSGIVGTYIVGRALEHRMAGAVASLLLALDPLYEYAAHVLRAELPSIVLQIWAVAFALLAMRATPARRGLLAVAAGAFLGCAALVKLFAIAALTPVALYLCAPHMKYWLDDGGGVRLPPWRSIWGTLRQIMPILALATAGVLGVAALVLLPFADQLGAVYDQVMRFHLVAMQANSLPSFENLRLIVKTLLAAPLAYPAMLAVLVIAWRRSWIGVPLILWALAALVTLVRQQPLFTHHIVLLDPALASLGGFGMFAAWRAAPLGSQRAGQAIVLLMLVLAIGGGLAKDRRQNAWLKQSPPAHILEMANALRHVSAPDEAVVTDDQFVAALANRDVPPQLVDTSGVRIAAGYLTLAQMRDSISRNHIRAILFASGRFERLPGFRAWVEQRYVPTTIFGHGGTLFLLR